MIEAINISKEYKSHFALQSTSFKVEKGEIFCLIGANGAGKSTTIKIFTNQINTSEGIAKIDGIEVASEFNKLKPIIAFLPENLSLYGHLSATENVDYLCKLSGLNYSKYELEYQLIKAGLEEKHFSKKLENYSKGMKQKVGIAFAMAKKAKVLFLDEPTSGLDPKSILEFSLLLKKLKEDGLTILMTSHDLYRTFNDADKIGIMKEGRLLEIINAKQISHEELESKYMNYMNT